MSEDIDCLAEKLQLSHDETLARLKEMYDGYHFTWPSPDVYNPFSLLNCMATKKLEAYWFGSGTPTYLIEMMRKFHLEPNALGETCKASKDDFDAPTETLSAITPLFYQSGYYTIKDYDPELELYTLDVPNKEIRVGLFKALLPNYLERSTEKGHVTIAYMSKHIKHNEIDTALQLLQTLLETVPYCNGAKGEGYYQQMLYVIVALLTPYRIGVEQHTAKDRTDITLETADHIYIMELKFGKSATEAMQQIEERNYASAFALRGKPITKVGIAFDADELHNLTEWIVKD